MLYDYEEFISEGSNNIPRPGFVKYSAHPVDDNTLQCVFHEPLPPDADFESFEPNLEADIEEFNRRRH